MRNPVTPDVPPQAENPEPSASGSRVTRLWHTILGKLTGVTGGKTRPEAAPAEPPWTRSIRGPSATVTISRAHGAGSITIRAEPSGQFVSKTLFVEPEEADRIVAAVESMDEADLQRLGRDLTYTDTDDRRIDDPNGAGMYMKEALLKLEAPLEDAA